MYSKLRPYDHLCCLQVSCVGQMICAVVADTKAHAKRGAAAVKISYEDLPDPVFTAEVTGCSTTSDLVLCAAFCSHHLLILHHSSFLCLLFLCVTGRHREVVLL